MSQGTILLGIEVNGDCVRLIPAGPKGVAVDLASLEGRTFQVHCVSDRLLRLLPVLVGETDTRCPVIVSGERCGCKAGHAGKHMWANGD